MLYRNRNFVTFIQIFILKNGDREAIGVGFWGCFLSKIGFREAIGDALSKTKKIRDRCSRRLEHITEMRLKRDAEIHTSGPQLTGEVESPTQRT